MERKMIIAGVGGQGVIFLTRFLAQVALEAGEQVMVSETHGMSQRGGSVISHLKVGNDLSPLIQRGTADVMLALDGIEAMRNLSFIRRAGCVFMSAQEDLPSELHASLERLEIAVWRLPAATLAMELNAPAAANVILAGFALAHPSMCLPYPVAREVLPRLAPRNAERNLRALELGHEAGERAMAT